MLESTRGQGSAHPPVVGNLPEATQNMSGQELGACAWEFPSKLVTACVATALQACNHVASALTALSHPHTMQFSLVSADEGLSLQGCTYRVASSGFEDCVAGDHTEWLPKNV